MTEPSLQERYAPRNICFGCGPANPAGLHIRSYPKGDEVVCDWKAGPNQEAYTGAVSGGILGTLLDCHSNWAATWHLMQRTGVTTPPCSVTAEFSLKFLRPTPSAETLHLSSRVVESSDRKAVVETTLTAGGEPCAAFRGTFVAVKEGHPAFHRW
jgi:acyl-coenzyme A thioesterase PaaI-like protein